MTDIDKLRRDYQRGELDEASAESVPLRQFRRWLDDAVAAQRWQRDKPLLALGHEARRQRTLKAWAQVDAGAPGA